MIVINLFAGPGAGKSTTASALFTLLKRAYYNVELVSEYAKDLVWEEREKMFSEQDYISAQQNKRLRRLMGKVDIVVTDSPLLLGMVYVPHDYYITCFRQYLWDVFRSYDNINFYIERTQGYTQHGRKQTASEAVEKDDQVFHVLKAYNLPFTTVKGDNSAEHRIFEAIVKAASDRDVVPFDAAMRADKDIKHKRQKGDDSWRNIY